jgi:alpha,alpha-trehalose phosphorylase
LHLAQRRYLDEFWSGADVELEGDPELQQAVRFALFHTLQAGARAEQRAIGAKGPTGPGYDGHTFWDTERFVLPALTWLAVVAGFGGMRDHDGTLTFAPPAAAGTAAPQLPAGLSRLPASGRDHRDQGDLHAPGR